MLTDNDILDIRLRNRFNRDVEALIAEVDRLRDVIAEIRDALYNFPSEEYRHIDSENRLADSEVWNSLCDLADDQ